MCGGVRWELSAPPVSAGYCHCTRCQRRTGTAASASARIAPGSLTITSGEELVRTWDPGDGGYLKAFCSNCGSALWAQNPADPEFRGLRLGSFDHDPGIRPSTRAFVSFAASWEPIPDDGTTRYPGARPG
jgi:hypothetical protein